MSLARQHLGGTTGTAEAGVEYWMLYPYVCYSAGIEVEVTEERKRAAVLLGRRENLKYWSAQIKVDRSIE